MIIVEGKYVIINGFLSIFLFISSIAALMQRSLNASQIEELMDIAKNLNCAGKGFIGRIHLLLLEAW